ncbi:MAG: ankyrin repeat domain-containing protein [Nitrosomonadales bacterium]|nr:ankyrin repeat domain-containing protein [Nitrosomonadales bacterium]
MKNPLLCLIAIAVLLISAVAQAQTYAPATGITQSPAQADYYDFEEMAIEKVKSTPASKIEKGRSALPFEKWLQNLAGKDAEMEWELNDCGEGGGSDRERDSPLCVGVTANLPDGRYLTVEVGVANASDINKSRLPGGVGVRNVYAGYKGVSFVSGSGLDKNGALVKLEDFMKVDAQSISLYQAAEKGDMHTAQAMLKQGADLHSGYGAKALFVAAGNGQLPMVRLLVDTGANVNAKVGEETVLSHAIWRSDQYYPKAESTRLASTTDYVVVSDSYFEIVKLLLEKGADAYSRNMALMSASRRQNSPSSQLDILRLLLKSGADVNYREPGYQITPLMWASEGENIEVVLMLLEAGAQVNAVSAFSNTALSASAEKGSVEVMRLLLEHGANVRPIDAQSPLIEAVRTGSMEKTRLLLEHGADINAPARITNITPLMVAALYGHFSIAKMLIEKGADVDQRATGDTALSIAIQQHRPKIAKLLRDAGARQ